MSPEDLPPQANEDILDMVEQYPDRFFAFCNIDPRALTNSADAPLATCSAITRIADAAAWAR